MPTTPISSLPSISLVRDPLQVFFQDSGNLASNNEEPTELEVQIEIEDIYGSNNWRRVGEILNPYGPDNLAGALIHRALQGALKATAPNIAASGLQFRSGICKRYRLRARDVVGGIPSGAFADTGPAHAWLAGQSYRNSSNDFVGSRAFRFLSTQGSPRYFHPSQRIYIEFITFLAATDANLIITAYYEDNTTEEFTTNLGVLAAFHAYGIRIPTPAWAKPLRYFMIALDGFIGGSMETINCFYTKPSQFAQEIFYLNSLGGYENFVFTGKTEESNTETGEVFEGQLLPPLTAQEGNFMAFNQRSTEGFTLRSGWINEKQRRALKDLTLRNEAYLVQGNQLLRLLISNASYQVRKDGEFLYSLEFQARFAYENVAYSRV